MMHTVTAFARVRGRRRRLYDARTGFLVGARLRNPARRVVLGRHHLDRRAVAARAGRWRCGPTSRSVDGRSVAAGAGPRASRIGLGLNAKYAMAYFLLCIAVDMIATPERRRLLRDPRLWAALALGVGADRAQPDLERRQPASRRSRTPPTTPSGPARWSTRSRRWSSSATQFGVFGPILFAALGVIALRAWRHGLPRLRPAAAGIRAAGDRGGDGAGIPVRGRTRTGPPSPMSQRSSW